MDVGTRLALPMIAGMIFTQTVSQMVQLPAYFKYGPRSIVGWVQLPLVILLIATGFLVNLAGVERLAELAVLIAAAAAVILVAGAWFSYRLAVKFYSAREF
jgi:hypothetical protein